LNVVSLPSIDILPVKFSDNYVQDKVDIGNNIVLVQKTLYELKGKIDNIEKNCHGMGYVYVGKDVSKDDFIKIGSSKDLSKRLQTFQTGQPLFYFIVIVESINYINLEKQLLLSFEKYVYKGECFKGLEIKDIVTWLVYNNYFQSNDSIYRYVGNNNYDNRRVNPNDDNNNNNNNDKKQIYT